MISSTVKLFLGRITGCLKFSSNSCELPNLPPTRMSPSLSRKGSRRNRVLDFLISDFFAFANWRSSLGYALWIFCKALISLGNALFCISSTSVRKVSKGIGITQNFFGNPWMILDTVSANERDTVDTTKSHTEITWYLRLGTINFGLSWERDEILFDRWEMAELLTNYFKKSWGRQKMISSKVSKEIGITRNVFGNLRVTLDTVSANDRDRRWYDTKPIKHVKSKL